LSDRLERLSELGTGGSAPGVAAIRERARSIRRRRRVVAGGLGAGTLAALAVVAVLVLPDGGRSTSDRLVEADAPEAQTLSGAEQAGDAVEAHPEPAGEPESVRSAPLAATAGDSSGAASGGAARGSGAAGAEALEVVLETGQQPVSPGGSVTFTLRACNRTDADVVATFRDSQRYDFEVSRDGAVVWRWSEGMVFAQVVGEERWASGECREWSESWDGSGAGPGSYEAAGILASAPERRSAPETVCLTVCG
jgi:hypothetical protein